jgi:hypothetical protein
LRDRNPAGLAGQHQYNVDLRLFSKIKMPPVNRMFSQQSEVSGGIKLSGFRLVLKFFILFPETLNSTRCVDQFLFAGKKRMAFGAYFHADIGFGRTNLYLVAARTPYAGISVIRMNAVFHDFFNPLNLDISEYFPCHDAKNYILNRDFRIYPEDGTIALLFIYDGLVKSQNSRISIS